MNKTILTKNNNGRLFSFLNYHYQRYFILVRMIIKEEEFVRNLKLYEWSRVGSCRLRHALFFLNSIFGLNRL